MDFWAGVGRGRLRGLGGRGGGECRLLLLVVPLPAGAAGWMPMMSGASAAGTEPAETR